MVMLLSFTSSQAQFINPTTPDIVIGSCRSYDVENSGTSILGDWQVTVVDGDTPSIIFYNHSTGQEDCHLLEAVNLGYTVNDPDVVWDYDSQEDIYVVYQLRGGPSGFAGIWAERWKMDNSGAFIYADITYNDPIQLIPVMAQIKASNSATYPNIDFHLKYAEVVVVWEDQGMIEAMADIHNAPGGLFGPYLVNSVCTGYTLSGTQPDVALGWDSKIVSFTYKQLNGGTNAIVVRQDAYLNIQAGNPSASCLNETMSPPVTLVDVNYPRISAPKTQFGYITSEDCNVAYAVLSSTGDNFIGSSTYKDVNYTIPYDPNCLPHSYVTAFRWSHDFVNSNFAYSTMNQDLRFDRNQKPVSVYAKDWIYNSWTWEEPIPTRFGLSEILTAVTQPNNEILTAVSYWPSSPVACTTNYYHVVASVDIRDYLVTGEVWNQSNNQNIVSSGSDMDHLAFAFYEAASGEIIIKKAATPGTPSIRTRGPATEVVVDTEPAPLKIKTYPNPTSGDFVIASTQGIKNILILDYLGRVYDEQKINDGLIEIPLSIRDSGLFFVHITSEKGEIKIEKISVNR